MKKSGLLALALTAAATATTAQAEWTYGVHYPDGKAAVDFMYGPNGNFKSLVPLTYPYNYYNNAEYNNACNTSARPTNRDALIAFSQGSNRTSTPDKDCHLLFDLNDDKVIDAGASGSAFIEHNGVNSSGAKVSQEFNNFWFDDNWLARYMSAAYARPQPDGLWAPGDYNRWTIIGGDVSSWSQNQLPYGTGYFDHLSFRGLHALITNGCTGNGGNALGEWSAWIMKSGAIYNSADQRFDYPNVLEDYYFGFFLILTQKMLQSGTCGSQIDKMLLQHAVSLRSHILSRQIQNASGTRLGWVTMRTDPVSLINTETTSLNVLGLGAGGDYAFEAGRAPMFKGPGNYFQRPHNVVSAVVGLSMPGMLNYGPYVRFPRGFISVDFHLRSPGAVGTVANIDIYDADAQVVLASKLVPAAEFSANSWSRIRLDAMNMNPTNNLEFRVYWNGTSNLDVSHVQVNLIPFVAEDSPFDSL